MKYNDQYSKEYPCIKPSKVSSLFTFCSECGCDINISDVGKGDIRWVMKSSKNGVENVQRNAMSSRIDKLFAPRDDSSICAECYFTSFLIEHNLPLSAADHAGCFLTQIGKKYMVLEERKLQT